MLSFFLGKYLGVDLLGHRHTFTEHIYFGILYKNNKRACIFKKNYGLIQRIMILKETHRSRF